MNSPFGDVFLFLTDLAWKSRMTIPVLVTTVFLIMDIRLQIEINIQSGQAVGFYYLIKITLLIIMLSIGCS